MTNQTQSRVQFCNEVAVSYRYHLSHIEVMLDRLTIQASCVHNPYQDAMELRGEAVLLNDKAKRFADTLANGVCVDGDLAESEKQWAASVAKRAANFLAEAKAIYNALYEANEAKMKDAPSFVLDDIVLPARVR